MMATHETLTLANLKTPKAAAVAGILFSILSIIVFALLRISVPADPYESGSWLRTNSSTVIVALNLVPFAGIAFLWFIGVLRDRLGQGEDACSHETIQPHQPTSDQATLWDIRLN